MWKSAGEGSGGAGDIISSCDLPKPRNVIRLFGVCRFVSTWKDRAESTCRVVAKSASLSGLPGFCHSCSPRPEGMPKQTCGVTYLKLCFCVRAPCVARPDPFALRPRARRVLRLRGSSKQDPRLSDQGFCHGDPITSVETGVSTNTAPQCSLW